MPKKLRPLRLPDGTPRPLAAPCRRCGQVFVLARKGRLPRYCPECNGNAPRERPAELSCPDCGAAFRPGRRGPLPARCPPCSHRAAQRRWNESHPRA